MHAVAITVARLQAEAEPLHRGRQRSTSKARKQLPGAPTLQQGLGRPCRHRPLQGSLGLVEGGELEVLIDGRRVATCIPGDFVGEMAFIDRAAASATVRACVTSTLRVWDAKRLHEMLADEPEIQRGFHAALGTNMSQKLRRKAMQAVSGSV